jgi:hypothetical protein
LTALPAVGLGLTTWALARHDLREMEAGRRDPAGWPLTHAGQEDGCTGVRLALLGLLALAIPFAVAYFAQG